MTLTQLRTFLEVARQGSVRSASEVLMIKEPSVSAALAALRDEVRVALVERDGRGIRLTAAGLELAHYAERILKLSEQAVRDVREASMRPAPLRLVAVHTAGEFVLPALLKRFRQANPQIQLWLEVGNRATVLERLAAREAELGFGGHPPAGGGIAGKAFLDNELIVVARHDHPLARRRRIPPALLGTETWLLREVGSGTRISAQQFFASRGIEPKSVLPLGSNGAVKQAAVAGLGITLLSSRAVAPELAAGALKRLAVEGTPLQRPWYVLYRSGESLSDSALLFLDLVRSPSPPLAALGAPR